MSIKVKSPWTALQSIKTQLRNTEMNFTTCLASITGGEDANISNTYIGGSSNVYGIEHTLGTEVYTIQSKVFDDSSNDYITIAQKTFNTRDELLEGYIGSAATNDLTSVSSVLLDLKQGSDGNSVIADICNAFQSSQNMSISDLFSIINTSSLLDEDKRKLGSYLQSCLSNGKANSYGWLSILEKIFQNGYDSANSGSIQMDRSSPFCIQPIVATVLNAISMVIQSIAIMIANAFRYVLMAVSFIVSFFSNYINKVASNTVSVDFESSTWYVKGPVKYCDEYAIQRDRFSGDNVPPIFLDHYGPFDIYSWPKDNVIDPNTAYYSVNAFVTVGFDVIKAITYFKQYGILMWQDDVANSVFDFKFMAKDNKLLGLNWKDYFYSNENYYLTQEECMSILSDPNKCSIYLMLLLQFDLLMDYIILNWYEDATDIYSEVYKFFYNNSSGSYPLLDLKYTLPYARADHDSVCKGFLGLFGPWFIYQPQGVGHCVPSLEDGEWVTHSKAVEWLQSYYNTVISPYAEEGNNSGVSTCNTYNNVPLGYELFQSRNVLYGSWNTDNGYVECESIPTERAITIPDVTNDKLIQIAAIVAAVITALVVARTIGNRIMQKRFTARRLNDSRNLTKLKEAYDANPNSEQAYNAYYKALRRYNLKAKLLGWNTYDPINNWFDAPDSGSTTLMGSQYTPDLLTKATNTATGLNTLNTTTLPALQTNITDAVGTQISSLAGNVRALGEQVVQGDDTIYLAITGEARTLNEQR